MRRVASKTMEPHLHFLARLQGLGECLTRLRGVRWLVQCTTTVGGAQCVSQPAASRDRCSLELSLLPRGRQVLHGPEHLPECLESTCLSDWNRLLKLVLLLSAALVATPSLSPVLQCPSTWAASTPRAPA